MSLYIPQSRGLLKTYLKIACKATGLLIFGGKSIVVYLEDTAERCREDFRQVYVYVA
jgi:hypothetical protein